MEASEKEKIKEEIKKEMQQEQKREQDENQKKVMKQKAENNTKYAKDNLKKVIIMSLIFGAIGVYVGFQR